MFDYVRVRWSTSEVSNNNVCENKPAAGSFNVGNEFGLETLFLVSETLNFVRSSPAVNHFSRKTLGRITYFM